MGSLHFPVAVCEVERTANAIATITKHAPEAVSLGPLTPIFRNKLCAQRPSRLGITNSCGLGPATLKVNLLETIAFDCNVGSSAIVGACRPPAFQDGSLSKFCSPLEVVGPRGLSIWTHI
jgi:hypothetical protein